MASVVIATFTYPGTNIQINILAEQIGSDVKITIDSVGSDQSYDLNGLFFDFGNDGGTITKIGSNANNMNGADSADGTQFNGFDAAFALGSIGGSDANYTDGYVTLLGKTVADLEGAEIGLRMQGVTALGGGSLKLGEIAEIPPANSPPVAVDDDPACGTESTPITGKVTTNDSDPDGDPLTVTAVNGVALPAPDADGWSTIVLTNGTLKIKADGTFEYTYTGANLPVGGHADPVDTFDYTISDGTGIDGHTDTASVELCVYADPGSPGYWMNHDSSGPQANDWDIAENTSFETYFGVVGPYSGQWDTTNPINGTSGLVNDITLAQAFTIPQGGDGPDGSVLGSENHLAQEATTALLSLLDEDASAGFITNYIYQRANFASADPGAANDLTGLTAAQIVADLKLQVQDAFAGTADDAYTIAELTDLLIATHE